MKVIVICEHGNDWPIAAIEIPEGSSEDETFAKWYRAKHEENITDEALHEVAFLYQELTVQKI